jgi:hypothetical protein
MKMMPWPVGLPASKFHLVVGNCDAGAGDKDASAVGDDRHGVIAFDLEPGRPRRRPPPRYTIAADDPAV